VSERLTLEEAEEGKTTLLFRVFRVFGVWRLGIPLRENRRSGDL